MTDRVVHVTLAAKVNTFIADVGRAEKGVEKVGTAAEQAAQKMAKQTQAMREGGIALTAAGAVALAATAIAVKAAIDWETAWAGVTKTVDGSALQMAKLEGELRSLAKTLPATHQEIAAVAEAAGQLGVKRADITAFTKTMIDLGETTNLSADEAATSIAQLMNVMGTAPDQVDNLGSALVALGNDGASTERDIVQMAQRIAGAGRIVGLTEGEVLGFANALASVGIEAEAGGSAVSRIMTDIAMSVSAGGEELEQFATVAGMSSKDFQKAFKDDPADAIATFVEGLGRIDAEGGDVFKTLSDLGQSDIRVSQALLGMANSGDLLRKSLSLGNSALKENTALNDEAAKRYETTASKLQVLGNKANDAAIDFGDAFLPAISATTAAVGGLLDAFSALPDGIKQQISLLGGLAAAVALMAGAFLLAVPKVAELRIALGTLATSSIPAVAASATRMQGALAKSAAFLTGPWGIALAAAAVGAGVLQQALDRLKASSEEMQNSLVTARDGLTILSTAAPSQFNLIGDIKAQFADLDDTLQELDEFKNKPWFQPNFGADLAGAEDALSRIGNELSTLAGSDLPSAQKAFQLLSEQTDGSDESMLRLLDSMGPQFQDAMIDVASARNIDLASMTDAERAQALLNIAMEEAPRVTATAAEAYKAAASEAEALQGEITSLIDAINAANGVGQDAVSANARYQSALAGITTEVDRQKEAFIQLQRDAYQEANGSLDGFVGTLDGFALSLDQATAAGSANADMLAGVAADAQTAAEAQYVLDQSTMTAKDATDKYAATLAAQRQAFIDSAVEAGFNADEVKKLADQVFALPDEKTMKMLVDTASANQAIEDLKNRYNNTVITLKTRIDAGASNAELANLVGIGIPNRANGGILPGPPSSKDNMLVHAATGEFIVNAAATQRNRALLEQINSGRYIPGFANGGFIQPQYARPSQVIRVEAPQQVASDRPNVSLTIQNPVVRDLQQEAWDSAQIVGGF